ncbi:hypothetical protein PCANB_000956 [Pneumocystis canis]|nr:hypothetical protein PCANB_000956 [Pneumocystis canis]
MALQSPQQHRSLLAQILLHVKRIIYPIQLLVQKTIYSGIISKKRIKDIKYKKKFISFIVSSVTIQRKIIFTQMNDYYTDNTFLETIHSEKPTFDPKKVTVLFILGGPGSGKGTQCTQLVKDYGFVHLSAGDLLRKEQARPGSIYTSMIQQSMQEGQIVPMHVTIALLKHEMVQSVEKGKKRFLIDGFPRKIDQCLAFEKNVCPCQFTLNFYCPEHVMMERLLARGRRDDNIDTIKKRFKTHQELTIPVIKYMEEQKKLVQISCENSIETTYQQILNQIGLFLKSMP